ncbi:MAG: O-antigen ligase domain-containing protein [Planctomycetaceae bacterium]|nr:MAG: O-antigen ligase domain-containing protein [Planctomycetaceae bacterium]
MKRPLLLIATSAVLFIGTLVFIQVIMTTHAGARFTAVIDNTSDATEKRTDLYHDAWKVFSEHPISGVGLNCFVLHTQILQQAHSEYMEIAADTGIVGAILYFSIYFVMWRRAGKIVKYSSDQAAVKIAQLFRAFLVVIMLTNFGRWNYDAKTTWIMFASFIGYLCVAWNDVLANAMQPTPVTNEESVPAELPDGVNVSK